MRPNDLPSSRMTGLLSLLIILIPILAFYTLLGKSMTGLPIADDYNAILRFANGLVHLHGPAQVLAHILNFQHNEYKLMLESSIVVLQYKLEGHINFITLNILGNLFVLLIFLLLLLFCRRTYGWSHSAVILVPVAFLLFQLQYAYTVNWAMASLQNLTVIAFSLAAIYLLCLPTEAAFAAACAAMVLAIMSSGNGFLTVPIGIGILAQQRRFKIIGIWLLTFLVIGIAYFSHYNLHIPQPDGGDSILKIYTRLNPVYALTFLGASAARLHSYLSALGLGLVLLGIFILAICQKYYRKNPPVFYAFVFILLTAVSVSGMRSGLGIEQSLTSRYRIYSNLALILSYLFLGEVYLARVKRVRVRRVAYALVLLISARFGYMADLSGYRLLLARRQAVLQPFGTGRNQVVANRPEQKFFMPDCNVLPKSIQLGVYRPVREMIGQPAACGLTDHSTAPR